ncbi:MAG TPA: adenylate/guanylate cyclase domain-containing protein [Acidimicrobiales bacterium]|nr:adenylate/guanylate cyclase domain-containing protein [Acidimicrobiales bacterium]
MNQPSPYQPEAPGRRVLRTFAFVDLSGFTALTDADGDERAVEVLTLFRNAVRGVAGFNGVRVAKWLGDGAMLVSIETEPLIEAILEIERRIEASGSALPLRAGIAEGEVILFEGDDYIGRAVNLAARLCDLAEPHQVLAPVALLAEHHLRGPVQRLELRGMASAIEAVDLRVEVA